MSFVRDGISASPGIVIGPAFVLRWEPPRAPHVAVPESDIELEIERFNEAREWAKARIREIQQQ
ncbi:MAG TPA: phosphoenolpyruvate-utilizing N-terminal domain-containing protein, partial [Longimicrobiales bacterium]|nr:phosphoenolpyruvate-utilizing N-terminal domain-containing protein [Longimicrobiales bacterium]